MGVATEPGLRERFSGKPEFVENFFMFIAEEVRELMAQLGFRTVRRWSATSTPWTPADRRALEGPRLDLVPVLPSPSRRSEPGPVPSSSRQDHGLDKALDQQLIAQCREALDNGGRCGSR